jgi:hypothetical protein
MLAGALRSSYEVVDARRKFTLMAGAAIRLLVLLAVLARVRGAGFDLIDLAKTNLWR